MNIEEIKQNIEENVDKDVTITEINGKYKINCVNLSSYFLFVNKFIFLDFDEINIEYIEGKNDYRIIVRSDERDKTIIYSTDVNKFDLIRMLKM